jgi:ankyrin repeat protein
VSETHNKILFECCKKGKIQQLLDALANTQQTEFVDERYNTLLCTALKHGQWQTYTTLLDSNYSFTPIKPLLITACQYAKDDIMGIQLALQYDADVNVTNSQGRTALMTACLLGHVNKAIELLDNNANVDSIDQQGNTALIDAVHSRNKKLIELILKYHPQVNHTNNQQETALILCVKHKSASDDIVKLLLEAGSDPELKEQNQQSAWLIAKQKHPKISRTIEKHLNDINQIELPFFNNDYQTPQAKKPTPPVVKLPVKEDLPQANSIDDSNDKPIEKVPDKPIIKPFALNQKKVNKTNKQEWFHAAKTGNLGGLNRMIIEGIDINCVDEKGCTALIRASGHSRRAVVSYLLQQNADVEMRSHNGSTALSSSIIGNCRRVAGLLLENKANPNGVGPSDYSYATIAAAQWNDAMLSILYRHGGDIFICNNHGQNLLHIIALAAEYYNNINSAKSSIQFLLDHGMDINAVDNDGNTALMILCGIHKKNYPVDDRNIASIAHYLIKLKAAPAITNQLGKSALDATRFHKLHQTKGVIMNALSWNLDI